MTRPAPRRGPAAQVSNATWLVAVACALVAPLVAVGLCVVATILVLALPLVHLQRTPA